MRDKQIHRCFVLSILLAAGLSAACQEDNAAARTTATVESPQASITPSTPRATTAPQVQDEDTLIVAGPLVVENQLDLVAQREGMIIKLHADTGKRLAAGDLLAQLDDRQTRSELEATRAKTRSIEADLKSLQAEEKVMQADYDRAKKMWDAALLPREQLEHAKFKMESEEWEIRRVTELLAHSKETERGLELELEKTQIRAPFEGVVARRYIREGESVEKGARLFWFTAEAPLRMRFTVPEKYLSRLRLGQQFILTSPNFPQERHTSRVIEISPVVDPASGTVEAMVELVGSTGRLRTGMTASLAIGKAK